MSILNHHYFLLLLFVIDVAGFRVKERRSLYRAQARHYRTSPFTTAKISRSKAQTPRSVTFKKGVNPLQFSWANTLIDPTSVQLRFISNWRNLDLLDTTFPHDKPQMLFWNVQSDFDGAATIEITYFTSGITWSADYLCVANAGEKQMKLEGFVRVTNNSGEEYEDAHIRLVVGTINLVEKIAQLARIPLSDVGALDKELRDGLKLKAAETALDAMPRQLRPYADGGDGRKSRSSRKASANISSSRSRGPKRFPTAGRSACAPWKPERCRSKSNTAIARRNMATNSSACIC